jgi:xanthine dehydrogenase accessory factor
MHSCLHAASTIDAPAILITVARVEGSAPREVGAKMLVTLDEQFDTIGGGHLEFCAIQKAREILQTPAAQFEDEVAPHYQRFALGPSLGQCCGGVVYLLFETLTPQLREELQIIQQRWLARMDSTRYVCLDAGERALADELGDPVIGHIPCVTDAKEIESGIYQDQFQRRWLVDVIRAHRQHLMLFGAGHVGTALVKLLADLPCYVTWVDERDAMFPANVPANVQMEQTDTPESLIAQAPSHTSYLVMTHSHALDQRLSEAILRKQAFTWFGLIGSRSKRMQFESRLRPRGIPASRLTKMICPIGLPDITGKAPAVIALSVAAQLVQVWEAANKNLTAETQRSQISVEEMRVASDSSVPSAYSAPPR